ncbi:signal peptide protein [Limosilactobacillus sp. STM2_1]|uniref:Signal peptide protein n=1 Tax=Limosilactobacillus rudii TaxID=2759755 RepID=A0A7W3ULY9_9LACO|nr:hypothetical protein [Limosilactobacillus rudii]MBB1079960.1 signal peptide protein [Limosilactobacillus rudii]MBB1098038.1 signal peptide protein [Limosilactobacillus rudii]MCD7135108.1 signal peptide protein [Limosilactobacillus rudii]
MLETDETKKDKVIGVNLVSTETIGGQVKVKNDLSASSIVSLNESSSMKKLLESVPNFAAQQQKLSIQEPVIKNNPALGVYKLNDDLDGLQHGTYLQATNRVNHGKDRSLVSRSGMDQTASLVNYKDVVDLCGYGHLKNTTETAKSVEVVYTLPTFESDSNDKAQLVIDGSRVNEFDGFEYKDEEGNVIPGFDITYSYQGHEGEYSTVDTLKQRDDFSWEKVTAIMVFGSLLPNSSYRVEFPFKIVNGEKVSSQTTYHLNEYAFYDLTINQHTTSRLNFRLSTPIFAHDDYQDIHFVALDRTDSGYQVLSPEVQEIMPTLGDVPYSISNFGDTTVIDDTENIENVLWQGGHYFFTLTAIQSAIQENGYSVDVDETGRKLMNAYAFTVPTEQLDFEAIDFIPYIVVHQLLVTKDFTLKAEAKDKWTPDDGIVKLKGLSASNEEVTVNPEQTFIIDNSELDSAKPGTYNVMIGYFLNGSEDENMLITSPTTITVVENKQTINVYYVDLVNAIDKPKAELQPSDGKVLNDHTQTFTGKGDTTYNNQLWGPADGYEIFKYEDGAKEGTYDGGQPARDYYVYLTHKVEKIDEDHQVTRTIIFNMPNGAKQTIKQKGRIQRFGITDMTTGEKTWSDWSSATLPAVKAPTIPGYTSWDVPEQSISLTTKDSSLNVTYDPKKVDVTVKFVDEDGKVISKQQLTGLAGELIDYSPTDEINQLAEQGYLIVDNGLPKNARFNAINDGQPQEYQIVVSKHESQAQPITVFYVDVPFDRLPLVKPTSGTILKSYTQHLDVAEGENYTNKLRDFAADGYELFKADNGATTGEYFAGSPEQQYYVYLTHKTTPLKNEHKVTRTIEVVMPDLTHQKVVQEAIAVRQGVHDDVTGQDIWQDWTTGILPEYTPVSVAGYEADTVPSLEVDKDADDYEESITYTPEPAEIIVKFNDQFGKEIKVEKLKGKTGTEFDYDPANEIKALEGQGYVLENNNFPADHHFGPGKQTYVIQLNKLVAVTPHSAEDSKVVTNDTKQPQSVKNGEAVSNKKGIFAAFKGLF